MVNKVCGKFFLHSRKFSNFQCNEGSVLCFILILQFHLIASSLQAPLHPVWSDCWREVWGTTTMWSNANRVLTHDFEKRPEACKHVWRGMGGELCCCNCVKRWSVYTNTHKHTSIETPTEATSNLIWSHSNSINNAFLKHLGTLDHNRRTSCNVCHWLTKRDSLREPLTQWWKLLGQRPLRFPICGHFI